MSKHLKLSTSKVILGATALIVLYFLVTGTFNAVRSYQLRQEEHRLRTDINEIQSHYQRLEALKDYVNSDEYIESVAREQLGLVREGETGFVAISTAPTPTPTPGEGQAELWWEVLIR